MSEEKPPHAKGSDTSAAAAESMEGTAPTLRAMVLDLIRAHPEGLTTDEIEVLTKLPHQTASARVWELHKRCLIGDSGERRQTRSGRLAAVYKVVSNAELMAITRQAVAHSEAQKKEIKKLTKELTENEKLLAALGIKPKGDPQ